jgi:hypothetical protein
MQHAGSMLSDDGPGAVSGAVMSSRWIQAHKAQMRRTYTPEQMAGYEKCPCDTAVIPPPHVRDAAAERAITGGFNASPDNICPYCFLALTVNGTCIGCQGTEYETGWVPSPPPLLADEWRREKVIRDGVEVRVLVKRYPVK